MKVNWRSWFRREKKRAARLVRDPVAVLRATEAAGEKSRHARGPLARQWDDLQTTIRLVRAWARRDYRGVARSTIVLVVAGLLYFVSPIDAICDAIPVLGLLDDAVVLGWVFGQVRWELDVFREWESQRALEPPPAAELAGMDPNAAPS
ncbi:MAG TPA: YkvA family protein [Polyangia bacterium]|nr:YkvA family protein [Polyangia bacterium]